MTARTKSSGSGPSAINLSGPVAPQAPKNRFIDWLFMVGKEGLLTHLSMVEFSLRA
jgi:hypothetical protein